MSSFSDTADLSTLPAATVITTTPAMTDGVLTTPATAAHVTTTPATGAHVTTTPATVYRVDNPVTNDDDEEENDGTVKRNALKEAIV